MSNKKGVGCFNNVRPLNRVIMKEKTKWIYFLPDGSVEYNMKDAKIKLGVSKTRLIGMLKSGSVKRIENENAEVLNGYGETTN